MKWIFLPLAFLLLGCSLREGGGDMYSEKRETMVADQIERRGITDRRVLAALRKVERHLFVPEGQREEAYNDYPLPIGYGQTISQPYIVAFMTEILQLAPSDRVLEIGTGSGYQAAVLAELVKAVYSVEIVRPLAEAARMRLQDMGYHNVQVRAGDGYLGWPEQAPFDAIIVTAAPESVPEALLGQMKIGGKMIIPIGGSSQELYFITRTDAGFDRRQVLPVRFVPMVKGRPAP